MKTKQKGKYNPISAGIAYSIGNMMIKAIPFITLPLFTKILSTSDYGLYNTYLSYENIISILLGFGLYGTIRVAKIEYKEQFESYVTSIYGLQIFLSISIDIIAIIVFSILSPSGWLTSKLLVVLLVNSLSSQIYNIASAKYAINGEVKNNLVAAFLMTFLNIGISLYLCVSIYSQEAFIGRILGTCISTFAVAIMVFIRQIRNSCCFCKKDFWKFGLRMGAPLILHSLSLTLLSQCDKIMIQAMVGNSEAGIYSIAVTLSGIISVLVTSVDNAWAPWFYEKLQSKCYDEVVKYNNYMVILFSFATIVFMFISPEVIRIMTNVSYWDSIYALSPLLVSVLFNFFYLIPVNFEYYNKDTKYIAYSTVLTTIINIFLNYILIKGTGYIGAAYATCISKLILLLMHWRKAWKIENIRLMGIKEIFLCSMISVISCILVSVLNMHLWIRYMILFIIFIIAFLYMSKKGIFNLFLKKIKNRIK